MYMPEDRSFLRHLIVHDVLHLAPSVLMEKLTKSQILGGGGGGLQLDTWSHMVQAEPSIAAQVFQNFPPIHSKRAQYEDIYYIRVCHAWSKTCDSLLEVYH